MTSNNKIKITFDGLYEFSNLLTSDQCDEVVTYFDDIPQQVAQTKYHETDDTTNKIMQETNEADDKFRKGHVKFDSSKQMPYYDYIVAALETIAAETSTILIDDDVHIQFGIYDQLGDHFDSHKDEELNMYNFFSDSMRKLSASIQLTGNNEYTGCDLEMYPTKNVIKKAARTKGSMTVFHSFVTHKVTPLKSGQRKALVIWYKGPPWR